MGIYDEAVSVPRRTMILFFVVDNSGSMSGTKMGEVNDAIRNVLPELAEISNENADAQIKIAAMEFSSGCRWITPIPEDAESFVWKDLNPAGLTDFGAACLQLNEKLSKSEFMSDAVGSFAPAIFLMSDGEPTDAYTSGLAKLKENNWFKHAIKVAIAIGNDANQSVLKEFTGNQETVLVAHDPVTLRKMIRFVSVTASQIGSQSSTTGVSSSGMESKQEDMVAACVQEYNVDDMNSADDDWG